MERIKQALEKARQERHVRQDSGAASPDPRFPPAEAVNQEATREVSIDSALLRENRIIAGMPPGPFVDAYNLMRTRILQSFKENHWSTLGITSPGVSAGTSLTAINLAISIAREVDYSVLLVDANLRHPWMLEHFGLAHMKGLSDYLTSDIPVTDLLLRLANIDHLVVLPGGRPLTNSAEMLNSPKMIRLTEELKSRDQRRIIIYDLPPVLTSSDTLAFIPNVDATLVVVEEGATQKKELEQAIEMLSVTNIIGTILNKAEV